jgi:hypothetical protein
MWSVEVDVVAVAMYRRRTISLVLGTCWDSHLGHMFALSSDWLRINTPKWRWGGYLFSRGRPLLLLLLLLLLLWGGRGIPG